MKDHLTDCLCIRVDSPTLRLLSHQVVKGQYLGISDDQAVHAPIGGHVSRITLIPSEQQTIITLQTAQ